MNRTRRRKLLYYSSIAGLAAVIVPLLWVRPPFWVWILMGVALIIPGRIQGFFYRDFFVGRRFMSRSRFAEAIPFFERFLTKVRARPALKRLIWLNGAVYSRDIEAMTLNNLGAARLELGELDAAEASLRAALQLDPESPLPHLNLAQIHHLRGDVAAAEAEVSRARQLGYEGATSDVFFQRAGAALAAVEGHGSGDRARMG